MGRQKITSFWNTPDSERNFKFWVSAQQPFEHNKMIMENRDSRRVVNGFWPISNAILNSFRRKNLYLTIKLPIMLIVRVKDCKNGHKFFADTIPLTLTSARINRHFIYVRNLIEIAFLVYDRWAGSKSAEIFSYKITVHSNKETMYPIKRFLRNYKNFIASFYQLSRLEINLISNNQVF